MSEDDSGGFNIGPILLIGILIGAYLFLPGFHSTVNSFFGGSTASVATVSYCGDNTCNGNENADSCPDDCHLSSVASFFVDNFIFIFLGIIVVTAMVMIGTKLIVNLRANKEDDDNSHEQHSYKQIKANHNLPRPRVRYFWNWGGR
jgi:hypothetical protein